MLGNDLKNSLPASNGSSIDLKNITKIFGHVVANNDVSLKVEAGTIHGIVGENGAGKSTLMNILFGLYQPNNGTIFIDGKSVYINSPDQSIALGIGMVHQHFMLVPTFTVLENVMLGVGARQRESLWYTAFSTSRSRAAAQAARAMRARESTKPFRCTSTISKSFRKT